MLMLTLLVLGGWQTTQASYIYLKAQLGQYLIADAWSKTLQEDMPQKPWSWADTWPVAKLYVPGSEVGLYVLSGDHGQALAFGPGLSPGSAFPGEQGTTVISGHRDTHFSFMKNLQIGDFLKLQTIRNKTMSYRIEEMVVVDAETVSLAKARDGHFLALVTCYPLDGIAETSQRLLVIAEEAAIELEE